MERALIVIIFLLFACNKRVHLDDGVEIVQNVQAERLINAWPNSNYRLDAVHGTRIMYNYNLFQNATFEDTPIITVSPLNNLEDIDITDDGTINLRNRSLQYNETQSKPLPLTKQNQQFIKEYNGSLDINNKEKLFHNFVNYIKGKNESSKIGSYISSSTCAIHPVSNKNTEGVGNTFPKSVINCEEIGLKAKTTATFYAGERGLKDGRWYIDFEDSGIRHKAVSQIIKDISKQFSDFIFFDNVRYFAFDWEESVNFEKAYYSCFNECQNKSCQDLCFQNIKTNNNFQRDRSVQFTKDQNWNVKLNNYYNYYDELLSALNEKNIKGILNVSVLPYILGNKIEEKNYRRFKSIISGNGVAFEQAWKAKHSPRYMLNEINIYREILSEGTLILLYPRYNNDQAGKWFAAMTCILRESGDPIFNMRSPYYTLPDWYNWPLVFGPALDSLEFRTDCHTCMDQRGGFEGNFVINREFENTYLSVGNLVISKKGKEIVNFDSIKKMLNLEDKHHIEFKNESHFLVLNEDTDRIKLKKSALVKNSNDKYQEDYIFFIVKNYKKNKPLKAYISVLYSNN